VKNALQNGHDPSKERERGLEIDWDSEVEILNWIPSNAQKDNTFSRVDFIHSVTNKFGTDFTKGCVDSFIIRHEAALFDIMNSRQEDPRLGGPSAFPAATIEQIKTHCIGWQVEFLFNLDKVGISEWEDEKLNNVQFSLAMKDEKIH
jgi:hypothetical protein